MSIARRNSDGVVVVLIVHLDGINTLLLLLINRSDSAISASMKDVVRDQSLRCRSMASAFSVLSRWDLNACPATVAVNIPMITATSSSVRVNPML